MKNLKNNWFESPSLRVPQPTTIASVVFLIIELSPKIPHFPTHVLLSCLSSYLGNPGVHVGPVILLSGFNFVTDIKKLTWRTLR